MMRVRLYFHGRRRKKRGHYQSSGRNSRRKGKKLRKRKQTQLPKGKGAFETVDEERVNRGVQANLQVDCSHKMSLSVLKSKCTTQKKEIKLFSHYTGFRSYSQFMEFLELVLPGLNRNNLVYWGNSTCQSQHHRLSSAVQCTRQYTSFRI